MKPNFGLLLKEFFKWGSTNYAMMGIIFLELNKF